MFSDPKSNRTHREDIPDDQVHIRAAEDILADHTTKMFVERFAEMASNFLQDKKPLRYPCLESEAITDLLMSLDGELLGEWEAVINGVEVDLFVSSFGDQKISRAKGECPLEPGVSMTISADTDIPDSIYLFAQGDKGDIVLPDLKHVSGHPLNISFSPLRSDQDYRLRIVRILEDQKDQQKQ
jgi:hypothetical protein